MTTEAQLLPKIRMAATALSARLFRNQVGFYTLIDGRKLRSGLAVGSSDLIGWIKIKITPEMVGRTVPIFLSPECKPPGWKPPKKPPPGAKPSEKYESWKQQSGWIAAVKNAGGIAGVVRSVEEFKILIHSWSPPE